MDGAPVARVGDVTSCGSKLIASQQAFSESGFDVGSISDEMTDEELYAMNDQMIEDAIADGGLTAEYAMSSEELGRIIRVHGENSVVGKQAMAALESRNDTHVYTDVEKQLESNRRQSAAARATRAQNNIKQSHVDKNNPTQRPLDMQQGQPPSLYEEDGVTNSAQDALNRLPGALGDAGKETFGILVDAGSEISPIVQTGSNIYKDVASGEYGEAANKGADAVVDKVQGTVIESVQKYGASKSKVIDKANNAYEDYNKAQDMKNQAEKAAEWKRNQNK